MNSCTAKLTLCSLCATVEAHLKNTLGHAIMLAW